MSSPATDLPLIWPLPADFVTAVSDLPNVQMHIYCGANLEVCWNTSGGQRDLTGIYSMEAMIQHAKQSHHGRALKMKNKTRLLDTYKSIDRIRLLFSATHYCEQLLSSMPHHNQVILSFPFLPLSTERAIPSSLVYRAQIDSPHQVKENH